MAIHIIDLSAVYMHQCLFVCVYLKGRCFYAPQATTLAVVIVAILAIVVVIVTLVLSALLGVVVLVILTLLLRVIVSATVIIPGDSKTMQ